MSKNDDRKQISFIHHQINSDLSQNKSDGKVITRFPPEPNGFLHIGHAKSIYLNFGLAHQYDNAFCYLRFDDTNPLKEETLYINKIIEDVRWLGFDWGTHLTYASDYYHFLYQKAVKLIEAGKAYVCNLNPKQMRQYRGTLTKKGKESHLFSSGR